MIQNRMLNFFEPQTVAIIGASTNPQKTSGRVLHNLVRAGFPGKLFPINPTADQIAGVKCFASVLDLPEVPDVALSMVDASLVPSVLEQCGRKGIQAAIIGANGFSEAGPDGEKLQNATAEISTRYGIRVCGPNCNGLYNILKRIPIGYNYVHGIDLLPGSVAIASQSGALLGSIAHRAHRMGIGLSYFVSTGNEMDLELCDYVDFFLEDDQTTVLALVIEGLRDGSRFIASVAKAHKLGKLMVVLKLGRSHKGAITAVAHTARMAGAGEIYDAAFRQYGVISTDTIEAFLGVSQMAATQAPPSKGKLMVVSSTGGGASLIADKAEEYDIDLAELTDDVKSRIPAHKSAIITNPFDIAGGAQRPGFFEAMCGAFASDPSNDCLLLFLHELIVRERFASVFCDSVKSAGKTAVAVVNLVGEQTEQIFRKNNVPCFDGSVDACLSALKSFIDYGRFRASRGKEPFERIVIGSISESVREILDCNKGTKILPDDVTFELLKEYGFKFPPFRIASSLEEAKLVAHAVGYPVILKGIAPGTAHKSSKGLVSSPAPSISELVDEFRRITSRMADIGGSRNHRVLIQKYIAHDYEVILGIKYDPTFGPAVLFGMGGIFTEIIKDFSIRLAPITPTEAVDMLSEIRAFPLLMKFFQNDNQVSDLIVANILSASRLALDLKDHVSAIDINPLVLSSSQEAIVLDAKIHI
ncbi:MAG TPA: acetate--CoA ligase family protein [Candidatus Binatia bacterium]|jgi:acetyltransferase